MKLARCLLLLALIAAASATFGRRWELSRRGRCGLICGLTRRSYVRDRGGDRKCLGVFGFLASGVSAKLNIVRSIFGAHSEIGIATDIDVAVNTCLNLSRGVSLIINKWVSGLGSIFENLTIGITRLIFCVLGNPWENGNFISRWFTHKRAPAVCDKEFGSKWGWKRYLRGYSNWDEIIEYYNLIDVEVKIESLLKEKLKIAKISALTGTRKVIVDILFKLAGLLKRDFSEWKRNDYVEVTKYLVTIFGAVGSGYKVGTGNAVVDECTEYLAPTYKKEFNVDITVETTVIKEEIKYCDTESFNNALTADTGVEVNVDEDTGSNNDNNNSNNGGNGARRNGKTSTSTKTTEWEEVYDDEGNLVSSTRPKDE